MSVVIGWIDGGTTTGDFALCVARLASYELSQQRLHTILRVRSGPQLPEGRNMLVDDFLKTGGEWLFMIDSDMIFDHKAVENLLKTADPETAPVVGGLCFGMNDEIGQFPTIYRNVQGMPVVMLGEVPEAGVIEVDGTGAAFILFHRSVFEKYKRVGSQHPWFHRLELDPSGDHPGGILGEDISWCWHLRSHDVPIFIDVGVEAGHIKPSILNRATFT